MKSPDIQKVYRPITVEMPTKGELIKATGGEKMIMLPRKPAMRIRGGEIVLTSFSVQRVKETTIQANTEQKFTTTCCNNDWTRPDGSCPPSACTK